MRAERDKYQVWLSLGSNLGERLETLVRGAAYLLGHGLCFRDCSGVYETAPVGYTDQPDFYNMVLHGATDLEPLALLAVCGQAEESLGRRRGLRWGPRTLDVDILFIDDLTLDLPELTVPHPRLGERAFVLGPLGEMDPGLLARRSLPWLREGIHLKIPAADVKMKIVNFLDTPQG